MFTVFVTEFGNESETKVWFIYFSIIDLMYWETVILEFLALQCQLWCNYIPVKVFSSV